MFLKISYIHRKTPVLESFFNRFAGLQACNFIKKRLQHRCFPAKFTKFLRIPILKNICQQLLLYCTLTTCCYLSVLLCIQYLLPHHQKYFVWNFEVFWIMQPQLKSHYDKIRYFVKNLSCCMGYLGALFFKWEEKLRATLQKRYFGKDLPNFLWCWGIPLWHLLASWENESILFYP